MKHFSTLIALMLSLSALSQQYQFVNADNGLIIREKPDKNSTRLGKLEYGTEVKIINETGIKLEIKDGEKTIKGSWAEIEEVDGNQIGFVFSGYLTPEYLLKRVEIKFQDFSLKLEIGLWDDEGKLNRIHKDTAYVFAELGESPEGKKIQLLQSKFENVEIFQRHENSVTIMNEGPHCDLTNWKHYYSEWEQLPFDPREKTFISHTYNQQDWKKFIEVDIDELKLAVEKECGGYWKELINNIESVHDYHSGVSISRIFFKIILTEKDGMKTEKTIAFEIPMGC